VGRPTVPETLAEPGWPHAAKPVSALYSGSPPLRPLDEDWHDGSMESSRFTAGMQVPSRARPGALSAVVLAGLRGGAVDFVYACCVGLIHGRSVMRVWQGVASGWLGKRAADGGLATMALGIVTHFVIATTMAVTYALVAARVKLLYRRPVPCGIVYGLVLYAVMYLVVLSLRFPSAFPRWDGVQSVTDIASHVGVGLVIAVVLSRWARRAPNR